MTHESRKSDMWPILREDPNDDWIQEIHDENFNKGESHPSKDDEEGITVDSPIQDAQGERHCGFERVVVTDSEDDTEVVPRRYAMRKRGEKPLYDTSIHPQDSALIEQ
ncbi:Nn.00g110790.m01.CDS01 [Neocucurbitaria sp. VM-36]